MTHFVTTRRVVLAMAAVLAAAPALAQTNPVQVQDAWARATAPKAKSGGVFMTIKGGSAADKLVSASSDVAAKAALHETREKDGVMKMHSIKALPVPAGQTVELKPGSYHVMLTGLKQPLKEGESFNVTLHFEKAGDEVVPVKVQAAGAGMAMPGGTMGHTMPGMTN